MTNSGFDLTGRAAIVTGGTRGIGRAVALGLAQAGADVVATSRNLENVEAITAEILRMGRKTFALCTDVARKEQIERLVSETMGRFGRIDILVNSAGINPIFKRAELVTEEEWDEIVNVNLKGLFLCCQTVGRVMINQKSGKIINITSVNGLRGAARGAPYCSTKGAVVMLTKCLALDWVQFNIQVNAIGPGFIDTDLTKGIQNNKGLMDMVLQRIPQGRFGQADEVVGTALLLASDLSTYITGQTFFVDGGYTAM
ncbi:MAG: glucose 1-dehydrogenase [Deltaproteobacteria bacterium]|nr:glucose 1-dehydrogenase [Deltaproteobacteria bacterium]